MPKRSLYGRFAPHSGEPTQRYPTNDGHKPGARGSGADHYRRTAVVGMEISSLSYNGFLLLRWGIDRDETQTDPFSEVDSAMTFEHMNSPGALLPRYVPE